MPELGQAANTKTGTLIGKSIITHKVPTDPVELERREKRYHKLKKMEYKMDFVTSYSQLYRVLNLKSSMTVNVANVADISSELKIFNSLELNSNDVFLFLSVEFVEREEGILHPEISNPEALELLNGDNFLSFSNANGDSYVSKIQFGKRLLAIIQIHDQQKTSKEELKAAVQAKITKVPAPVTGEASVDVAKQKKIEDKLKTASVTLEMMGTKVKCPDSSTSITIDQFLVYLNGFNDTANDDLGPISYTTDYYQVAAQSAQGAALQDIEENMKYVLTEIDKRLNKLRVLQNDLVGRRQTDYRMKESSVDLKTVNMQITEISNALKDLSQAVLSDYTLNDDGKNVLLGRIRLNDKFISDIAEKVNQLPEKFHMLSTINSEPAPRKGRIGTHYAGKSSNSFRLFPAGEALPHYVTWEVGGADNNGASAAAAVSPTFDVCYKRGGKKLARYHSLFTGVRNGDCTQLPADIKPEDKLVIANPKGRNAAFTVRAYTVK